MAISKSIRRAPARARQAALSRSVSARRRRSAKGSPAVPLSFRLEQWRQLSGVVPRLRAIYGTAVTAERALRQQDAEQEPEIADCLRSGVCDPIADQIRALEEVTGHSHDASPGTQSRAFLAATGGLDPPVGSVRPIGLRRCFTRG